MDIAGTVAAAYQSDLNLLAVLVGGSVGRGHPDRWSDLELGVFWRTLPPPEQLSTLANQSGAMDRRSWPYDPTLRAAEEEFWLSGLAGRGLLVELQHQTLADLAASLDELLIKLNPDPYLLTVASALSRGVVLTGATMLGPAQQRAATYPEPLAVAVATRHGQIDNFWRWQMFADRSDLIALRAHFADAVERLAHLLFAANRRWWPGRKWLLHELANLQHVPTGTVEALHLAATASPSEAAPVLIELIEATYDVAERQLPDLDIARLRRIFRFQRQPLEEMPVWPTGKAADRRPTQDDVVGR
jgi:hypothetical protein